VLFEEVRVVRAAMVSATIWTMLLARWREGLSIRGSPVANTPNVTAGAFAWTDSGSRFALATADLLVPPRGEGGTGSLVRRARIAPQGLKVNAKRPPGAA
jgi:hypothetical protein